LKSTVTHTILEDISTKFLSRGNG